MPVARYSRLEEFQELGEAARRLGFQQVASGPFVRSSYHAREMAAMKESRQSAVGSRQ